MRTVKILVTVPFLLVLPLVLVLPSSRAAQDAGAPATAPAEPPATSAPDTGQGLDAVGEGAGDTLDDGGDEGDSAALEPTPSPIDGFFTDLNAGNVAAKVEAFYAPGVAYEDPMGRIEGREQLLAHFKDLLDGMESLSVDVKEEFVSGEETVALWTMTMTHKSLRSGEPIQVEGVSHVRFKDGRAVAQRDYYDLGSVVYENVPVIGMLVRWVKARI